MYQPTQNFIDQLNTSSRRFRARMTVGENQITDIKTFVLNTGSCGADTFSIGSVFASYVDIVMGNVDISLIGREFLLEAGILFSDDSIEYVPMGYFTVESPSDMTKERDQITAKAVDRITVKCSGLYVPTVAFPCTIKAVLDDIENQAGITIVCDLDTSGIIETAMNNLMYRDALGYIAGLLGGFCYADRDGNVKIAPYPTGASVEIGKDRFADLKPSETAYTIEALTVTVTEKTQDENGNEVPDISYSEGNGTRLSTANPYMTEALFNAMKGRVIGVSFYPGTAKFLGDPRLGPEDAISAINYADNAFLFPCMSLTHEFDGGFTTTISTPGKNESDNGTKGPMQKAVDALRADMVLAKVLIAEKITADEADLKYATIDEALILRAEIDTLEGNFASFKTGEFDVLKAGYADFQKTVTDDLEALTAKIDNLDAEYITVTELDAKIATLDFATVEELEAVSAKIDVVSGDLASYKTVVAGNFTAYDAEIVDLKAKDADLTDLIAEKAKITDLDAVVARTGQLETDVANVETLVNGNLTTANIQSLVISGDKFTIEDGFIKNAMIESLTFDKITGVDINTTNIEVHSGDGKSSWKDNTIQISDASRVRVQIGKDAFGDYNIYIWDKDGNLMFDPLYGIQEDGIKQAIIRNDMVSDTANISGSKLDIESVIKEVNDGTTNIKSTRIYVDEEGQTLSAAFSVLKTYSEGTRTISENNQTDINVMQGQISTLISNTTITKDGKTVQLKDAYNSNVADIDSIKTTISEHTSLIDEQSGEIQAVQTKANTIESDLTSTKQTISEVQTDLSGTKSNVATMQTDLSGLTARVGANETAIEKKADGNTVTILSNKVSTFESALDGFEASLASTDKKVSTNETAIASHETSISALQGEIILKVEQTDIDEAVAVVDGKFASYSTTTEMNAAITAKANEITSSVSSTYSTKKELTDATGRIGTLETWKTEASQKITDDAIISTVTKSTTYIDDLGEKVSADEIASSINQTAQSVLIDASKINLTGYVTVSDLSGDGTTVIDGANIATGTITADKIDVNDLFAQDIVATGSITGAKLIGVTGEFSGDITCDDGVTIKNLTTGISAEMTIENKTISTYFANIEDGEFTGAAVNVPCFSLQTEHGLHVDSYAYIQNLTAPYFGANTADINMLRALTINAKDIYLNGESLNTKMTTNTSNISANTTRTTAKYLYPAATPTTTAKTYTNSALKGKAYIDVLMYCSSNLELNQLIRVYNNGTTGFQVFKGSSYYQNGYVSFNNSTGAVTYKMVDLVGWTSAVVKLQTIVYY